VLRGGEDARELADPRCRSFVFVWQVLRVERRKPENERWPTAGDRHRRATGADRRRVPDLSLTRTSGPSSCLHRPTRSGARGQADDPGPVVMAETAMVAHLLSFCGADYTTRLLTEWVRRPVARGGRRGSSIPPAAGSKDARSRPAHADLLIDREALSTPDAPRYVRDFPADSGRFVCDADGYRAVVVNGEMLLDDGKWTGATPGSILRG
jgi:hypothetical protein